MIPVQEPLQSRDGTSVRSSKRPRLDANDSGTFPKDMLKKNGKGKGKEGTLIGLCVI